MQRMLPIVFAVVPMVTAAQGLRLEPGQVVCRDRGLIAKYAQRHPDFSPDPFLNCWPLPPDSTVTATGESPTTMFGAWVIPVRVSQPGVRPFIGFTFTDELPNPP
jgi:hypothetical protein